MAEITKIFTYPIKSCGAVEQNKALVTSNGLRHDRKFMIVDNADTFVSQRKQPSLALVRPSLGETSITVAAPGMEKLDIPYSVLPIAERSIKATLHNNPVFGLHVGSESSEWFSDYLHQKVRLIIRDPENPRIISERFHRSSASPYVDFSDSFPLLIASEESLLQVNEVIEKLGEEPVSMNRFRPNIVVGGDDLQPFQEDYWREIAIGAVAGFVVRACKRCEVIDTSQETSERGSKVRRALAQLRHGEDVTTENRKGLYFGQNVMLRCAPNAFVKLGDRVEVKAASSDRNVRLKIDSNG